MKLPRTLASLWDAGFVAIGAALLLLAVALLLPPVPLQRATYDYLVVFDLSQSMNVTDYEIGGAPMSRLAYAKHTVRSALRHLPCGSKIGWGAFAQYRTIVLLAPVEVCSNYNDLLESLEKIDGRMRWGNASEITKGVFWAMRAARDLGSETNVLLFTDGHEAPPLDSTRQAVAIFDDLTVGTIHGWILGVGGDTPRPIPKTDDEGNPLGFWRADEVIQRVIEPGAPASASNEHLSALHESHLRALASQVGFQYRRLDAIDAVDEALRDARLAKRAAVPTNVSWLPSALALLLLAIQFAPRPPHPPLR